MNKPLSKELWKIFKDLRDVSVVMYNELCEYGDRDQKKWMLSVAPVIAEAEKILMPRKTKS